MIAAQDCAVMTHNVLFWRTKGMRKKTSHFRIPSSDYLCLCLNRKILEIPPWRDCSCGFAQTAQPNLA
jgi:hypothetical protein